MMDAAFTHQLQLSLLLLFVALTSGCAQQLSPHSGSTPAGEHIITPFQQTLKSWQFKQQNKAGNRQLIWQQQDNWHNAVVISILPTTNAKLIKQQQFLDQPGKAKCQQYTSKKFPENTKINPAPANKDQVHNQPKRLMWLSLCRQENGFQASILHLLIQGQEHLYHLEKTWQNQISAESIKHWRKQFEQVYLCNSQLASMPCPTP